MPTTFFRICLLLILMTFHSGGYAASAHEREQLSLVQQQVDTIERLAAQAKVARTSEPNERYRFDYPRLSQDIQRIRQGMQNHLSPSRAQPHDAGELVGDYRLDIPSVEPSP